MVPYTANTFAMQAPKKLKKQLFHNDFLLLTVFVDDIHSGRKFFGTCTYLHTLQVLYTILCSRYYYVLNAVSQWIFRIKLCLWYVFGLCRILIIPA